jgi:signal peptidase I
MEPVLMVSDHLLIKKKFSEIKRGDIIVFKNPNEQNNFLIKRVIGLGNEIIEIRNGILYVNGNYFVEDKLSKIDVSKISYFRYITPSDEYFVLGENIENSLDSRHFGSLKKQNIVGIFYKLYWPIYSNRGSIN